MLKKITSLKKAMMTLVDDNVVMHMILKSTNCQNPDPYFFTNLVEELSR